jgi:sugar lactone lactonase YvrE
MRRAHDLMCLSVVFAAAVLAVPSFAAEEETAATSFESDDWTITSGRIVDHLGRSALAGSAFLKDVDFTDGVIEVDIAMDGRRCFPGIIFRAESETDTEIFYVRPHRPKNYSHALQYTPRFRGQTGWQLYSGPGFTAGGDIPLDRWVHVKLEVQGSRARIYFENMEDPALVVGDLKRGTAGGFIGVSAPPDGRVHFSNFGFSPDETLDFGPLPIRAVSRAGLTDWELSQPIAPPRINRDLSPNEQDLGEVEWQRVTADRSGLVDVARFLEDQPQLPQCVLARTAIAVERPERRKLLFGYSDEISVFLNGELLFRGDSAFRVRDSEFMGVVGLNDAVVLDLNKGKNELLFVITESFGGWGFMARTESLRTNPVYLAEGVMKSWELADGLMMPESAVWEPKRGHFYVSNINPAGAAGFGEQGFISRIDTTGRVLEMQWITGLRGPTGVAVLDDHLYAVERTGVAVIDLDGAEIIQRHLIESEGGFLNDIAVDSEGTLFVSDSSLGAIYRLKNGEAELWLRNGAIAGANGLIVQGDRLIATTMGSESLVFLNLETAKIESIIDLRPFGGDGITADGTDAFLVSDFNGLLLRVTPTGDRDVLIDTRDVGISLTDFAFAPEHALVVVPTLRGNSVMAFKLDQTQ